MRFIKSFNFIYFNHDPLVLSNKCVGYSSIYIDYISSTFIQYSQKSKNTIVDVLRSDDLIQEVSFCIKRWQLLYRDTISFCSTLSPVTFPNFTPYNHPVRVDCIDPDLMGGQFGSQ